MTKKKRSKAGEYKYDVCLSFAGDDRAYVEKVAEKLREAGVRVFYDRYEQVELWGKDLYTHLSDIYSTAARFCVVFVSAGYARRVWTNHERAAAQERAIREHAEYVLPVRFDGTSIPGLRRTIGYIDLKEITPAKLAKMIVQKLGGRQREAYLPPMPDLLLRSYVEDYGAVDPVFVQETAEHFLESLRRTNLEEREAIIRLFQHTCPADLPDNVHMNIDLLCRLTGSSERKLLQTLAALRSLGFYARSFKRRAQKGHIGEDRIISVEWHDLASDSSPDLNATDVAFQMMNVSDFAHCDDCAVASLRRLDFSHLSSSTLAKAAYEVGTGRRIPNIGQELRKIHSISVGETSHTMPAKSKGRAVSRTKARAR